MSAITLLSLIRSLERQSANTDTDWRWRAAAELRKCPTPYEVVEFDVAAAPEAQREPTDEQEFFDKRHEGRMAALANERRVRVLDEMVSRFLNWRLPDDLAPDAGITFKRVYNETSPMGPSFHEPVGTNLLTAPQARAMLEHVLSSEAPVPLTLEYIEQHIGSDEGDRDAVVALVREVEKAHGIK